jgi:hypothetical protein
MGIICSTQDPADTAADGCRSCCSRVDDTTQSGHTSVAVQDAWDPSMYDDDGCYGSEGQSMKASMKPRHDGSPPLQSHSSNNDANSAIAKMVRMELSALEAEVSAVSCRRSSLACPVVQEPQSILRGKSKESTCSKQGNNSKQSTRSRQSNMSSNISETSSKKGTPRRKGAKNKRGKK